MPRTREFSANQRRGLAGLLTDLYDGPAYPFRHETISYKADLRILDREGRVALFSRHERIRFLESGVGIFIDRVWGEGVLLANYHAESMQILDLIRTGSVFAILLGLPRRFRKGETFEVITERKVVGAFIAENEYWELAMPAPTEVFSLHIHAPKGRPFTPMEIVAPSRGEFRLNQTDGAVRLSVREPAVHVPYRLEWAW